MLQTKHKSFLLNLDLEIKIESAAWSLPIFVRNIHNLVNSDLMENLYFSHPNCDNGIVTNFVHDAMTVLLLYVQKIIVM